MNPRLSIWYGTDPLQEKYPNVSSYVYCIANPIGFFDYNGKEWKYTRASNGNILISVDVELSVEANLSNEQVIAYKTSINNAFNEMLQKASNGKVFGSVTFEGHKIMGIHTPVMVVSLIENSIVAGMTSSGSSFLSLLTYSNKLKQPDQFAYDFIHELLHTLRLEHPFELTQTEDTELIKIGPNSYQSTSKTTPDILENVMMYDMIKVDGQSFKDIKSEGYQNKITLGQIDLMLREIDLQQKGSGCSPQDSYWFNIPGYEVK